MALKPDDTTIADWLLLGAAGAGGAIARYLIHAIVAPTARGAFPWSTLAINCAGSFAFGLVTVLAETNGVLSPRARVVVLTGFLGAFTTFSTFAFENAELLRLGHTARAMANILAQNLGAIVCVFAGAATARGVLGGG
ncbi:MAG: fluoride efflux transporter CrcB [Planctomycetota bacterium]|jgi:CrcB protein